MIMIMNKAGDEQWAAGAWEERGGEEEKISAKRARSEFRSTTSERSEEKFSRPRPDGSGGGRSSLRSEIKNQVGFLVFSVTARTSSD